MKSNKEIRKEAWTLLWSKRNFLKISGTVLFHAAVFFVVFAVVLLMPQGANDEFSRALASLFVNFILGLFLGIMFLGLSSMSLALVKGEAKPFRASFIGYLVPFRAFFAFALLNIVMTLWLIPVSLFLMAAVNSASPFGMILAAVLYITAYIAISYRYRFYWYVKAENPASGAFETLRRSVELVNGHKFKLFKFDMSYYLSALWLFVPIIGFFIFFCHRSLGSAIYYRDAAKFS